MAITISTLVRAIFALSMIAFNAAFIHALADKKDPAISASASATRTTHQLVTSAPCSYPLVTNSPLTVEDYTVVSLPVTECLISPLDTITLQATTPCIDASSTVSWVTEGDSSSSRVMVVDCFETPASKSSSSSSASTSLTLAPSPAQHLTLPCEIPAVHTSPLTLIDGSVTSVVIAVCKGGASTSISSSTSSTSLPPPNNNNLSSTTSTINTIRSSPEIIPTRKLPMLCLSKSVIFTHTTVDGPSIIPTQITTCVDAVPLCTATTIPLTSSRGDMQLRAGAAVAAKEASLGDLPSALTSFPSLPTETTLIIDTSVPPVPAGSSRPFVGGTLVTETAAASSGAASGNGSGAGTSSASSGNVDGHGTVSGVDTSAPTATHSSGAAGKGKPEGSCAGWFLSRAVVSLTIAALAGAYAWS
ncbi:hypothetical protein NKR23_g4626 [Pleurostoma richardsiae]|uniref:Uncharacterized protein n=1 Tax=Pleurostoma richardsiae TaxID=41990 RepID=A0AA38RJ83_9PEZI|nr:hypothetical protein NKR23_g4626 [Pleurostoma richardsiae]